MQEPIKKLGTTAHYSPAERVHRHDKLNRDTAKLRPYTKPKGKILRFKTYDELDDFVVNRAVRRM